MRAKITQRLNRHRRPIAGALSTPRAPRFTPALIVLAAVALLTAPSALAVAPTTSGLSFSKVTETSAGFEAQVNPQNREVKDAHFQYIPQAKWEEDGGAFGAGTLTTPAQTIPSGTSPVAIKDTATGLIPGTAYRLRVYARSALGTTEGPEELIFATLASPPTFSSCTNDPFRTGEFALLSHPGANLPECRAYERASPQQKNGNDALGVPLLVKAAAEGNAISFGSAFGIPGGTGAQLLPTYAASRGAGEWSTRGLLPPAALGAKARAIGWLEDFSATFASAVRLTSPRTEALFELHADGAPPTQITPYVPNATSNKERYHYVGAAADGSVVFFEASAALPAEEGEGPIPTARQGSPNLYAWDASSGRVSLVSRLNSEAQSDAALPRGAFAGPYDWAAANLNNGGTEANYYTQEERAVSVEGKSAFFTAMGSGQLYERLNPTQSPLDGQGQCTDPDLACTIHVSASEKEDGESPDGTDPAGSAPAAFHAASADGSIAFFTSSEKLTDDANTGPEQPLAQIGAAIAGATEPEEKDESLLSAHALGLALSPDGEHLYWADPALHSIGRAAIDPLTGEASAIEPSFIVPEETECENHFETEPGVLHSAPAAPRYVAVDAEHVYWTNTGPLGENKFGGGEEEPVKGCGTIGRATINSTTEEPEDPRPEFITGAFNPQGIAVDSEHVYWANAATRSQGPTSIGWAPIGGGAAELLLDIYKVGLNNPRPYGVALDATHVYFAANDESNNFGYLVRIPLAGGAVEVLPVGNQANLRGVAIDAGNIYWANQGEGAIGRLPIDEFNGGACEFNPACEPGFIEVDGSPEGLVADPATSRLYWSVNGEAPLNPGNDLYRFDASTPAGSRLTDLTPDATEDGAEVIGVLGASEDGSRLYFVANGVLASGATGGDCHTTTPHGALASLSGHCNLYRWHEDLETHATTTSFIARLNAGGGEGSSDKFNWVPSPLGLFGEGSYLPRRAELSADGKTLIFRSQEQLTGYENHGVPELYRYREGDAPPIRCLTCNPTGMAPSAAPGIGTVKSYPNLLPGTSGVVAALDNRFLAADGDRAFFETPEALVGNDTNGAGGCPLTLKGRVGACNDVYEWEAPGTGSCSEQSTSYAPVNEGCIYLISTGKSAYPSLFADASESGEDVFFFTREGLISSDEDNLQDVYDARAGGGLLSQNPLSFEGCEGEACKPAATPQAQAQFPTTPEFHGPGNPSKKPPRCPKGTRKVKAKSGTSCSKPRRGHHRHHRRTHR